MPKPPSPLSAILSNAIDRTITFLKAFHTEPTGYCMVPLFDTLPGILEDCDDTMMSLDSVLLRSLPQEDDVGTIIDLPLTLELRTAIAQAAQVHRVLRPMRNEYVSQIAELVRREVELHDLEDEEWEPYRVRILEARCEALKFLAFAFEPTKNG